MTITSKIAFSMALVGVAISTQANPITGSISFNGNVTPYTGAGGAGSVATDYSAAHSLVFGASTVSAGANGSFAGVTAGSAVNLPLVLGVNGPSFPTPGALWTTAIGGFSFTLSTLTEDALVSPFNTLTLRGAGTLSDGNPADNNTGTWVATFTLAKTDANGGVTFSWNSSGAADLPPVPEAGMTIAMLGAGLLSLGAFSLIRKQSVA